MTVKALSRPTRATCHTKLFRPVKALSRPTVPHATGSCFEHKVLTGRPTEDPRNQPAAALKLGMARGEVGGGERAALGGEAAARPLWGAQRELPKPGASLGMGSRNAVCWFNQRIIRAST